MGNSSSMTYLTSTNEAAINAAQNQISINCQLPNSHGTQHWDIATKAYGQDLWFIAKPPEQGWGNPGEHFTQEDMMSGVDMTNIIEQNFDSSWFPPEGL